MLPTGYKTKARPQAALDPSPGDNSLGSIISAVEGIDADECDELETNSRAAVRVGRGWAVPGTVGPAGPRRARPHHGCLWRSLGGLQEGLSTESAIKQEAAIACLLLPFTFFIARDLWTWVALVGSLFFVLSIEFLNTAIERLCNHIHPDRHEAIRITKDLASAGYSSRWRSPHWCGSQRCWRGSVY